MEKEHVLQLIRDKITEPRQITVDEFIGEQVRKIVDELVPMMREEIKNAFLELTPRKGVHYFDGEKGEDGKDSKIPGPSGKDGIGIPGKDGRNITPEEAKLILEDTLNLDDLTTNIESRFKSSDASSKKIEKELKKLKETVMLNYGGHGSKTTRVIGEIVPGSGTSFTLTKTPVAGTQAIYGVGQRLTLTADYSISGKNITTVNSWSSGDIVADYDVA